MIDEKNYFDYEKVLVRYAPETNIYYCQDNMIGMPLGRFNFDAGPGWVFYASGGLIMDELGSLARFQEDLQEMSSEVRVIHNAQLHSISLVSHDQALHPSWRIESVGEKKND